MKFASKGSLYMLYSAFFFSCMAITVKALGGKIPSQEIVLARSIFLFVATLIILKKQHLPIWGRKKKLLFLRGLFGFLGLSAFFYTLTEIPISESVILQYTSPLFTAFIAIFMLKESISGKQWLVYLIAFLGIVLIVKPGFSLHIFPAIIGLAGACSSGLAYNLIRKLKETEHPLNIILYLPALSIPLSLPAVLHNFKIPSGWEWILLFLIGLFTFVAQIFLTLGLHLEKAAKATNISYISIVFSITFGLIIWGEIPDVFTILGSILVISAISWTVTQH